MADAPTIPNEAETRALLRHAELVSASTVVAISEAGRLAQTWTLKQVQGDGGACG
jgi:hypothetical protein